MPAVGAAAAPLGFGLAVVGMWGEVSRDWFWQLTGTLLVAAGFAALVSVLALARLAPRFAWAFRVAFVLAAVVAVLGAVAIWTDVGGIFWRVFGVFSVLLAAFSLALPVLHRVGRDELTPERDEGHRVRFCPSCGRRIAGGASSCAGCGAKFELRFL